MPLDARTRVRDGRTIVETTLTADGHRCFLVAVPRDVDSPPSGYLRPIVDHVGRALSIGSTLEGYRSAADHAAMILDCCRAAVIVVDDRLRVVHLNQAARVVLSRRDCLKTDDGVVEAIDDKESSALRRAVRSATRPDDSTRSTIALRRIPQTPAVVHVVPLPASRGRSGGAQKPLAALFVLTVDGIARRRLEAIAALCDLTRAETDVFALIAVGKSPADTATRLGMQPSTVRTHLLRIFEKTGLNRQTDVVVLANRLAGV
jgi:DNA-binding CsgD family transcriptional regulator